MNVLRLGKVELDSSWSKILPSTYCVKSMKLQTSLEKEKRYTGIKFFWGKKITERLYNWSRVSGCYVSDLSSVTAILCSLSVISSRMQEAKGNHL